MNTSKPTDDIDALRILIDTLKDFEPDDQQRIFRWAAEKLGLPQPFGVAVISQTQVQPITTSTSTPLPHTPFVSSSGISTQDIKSFVTAKNPRSDVQFAATVAYYFQFEAPLSERKDSITGDDLQDACRKAGRDRLRNPGQTLRNAHTLGLLDKTAETGHFSVNTVGENLVAMTLPGDSKSNSRSTKRPKKNGAKSSATKKAAEKITPKKATKA